MSSTTAARPARPGGRRERLAQRQQPGDLVLGVGEGADAGGDQVVEAGRRTGRCPRPDAVTAGERAGLECVPAQLPQEQEVAPGGAPTGGRGWRDSTSPSSTRPSSSRTSLAGARRAVEPAPGPLCHRPRTGRQRVARADGQHQPDVAVVGQGPSSWRWPRRGGGRRRRRQQGAVVTGPGDDGGGAAPGGACRAAGRGGSPASGGGWRSGSGRPEGDGGRGPGHGEATTREPDASASARTSSARRVRPTPSGPVIDDAGSPRPGRRGRGSARRSVPPGARPLGTTPGIVGNGGVRASALRRVEREPRSSSRRHLGAGDAAVASVAADTFEAIVTTRQRSRDPRSGRSGRCGRRSSGRPAVPVPPARAPAPPPKPPSLSSRAMRVPRAGPRRARRRHRGPPAGGRGRRGGPRPLRDGRRPGGRGLADAAGRAVGWLRYALPPPCCSWAGRSSGGRRPSTRSRSTSRRPGLPGGGRPARRPGRARPLHLVGGSPRPRRPRRRAARRRRPGRRGHRRPAALVRRHRRGGGRAVAGGGRRRGRPDPHADQGGDRPHGGRRPPVRLGARPAGWPACSACPPTPRAAGPVGVDVQLDEQATIELSPVPRSARAARS